MGYPSDLTEIEGKRIKEFFKRSDPQGNQGRHDKRLIVNALLYVFKRGIQWCMLPKDYPPWQTVYDHYRRWNQRGLWEKALGQLTVPARRKRAGQSAPSYAIIDSQIQR